MKTGEILAAISGLSEPEQRLIYSKLREKYSHKLEKDWGLEAHAIMEAIARSGDLTQRGIRGVIAESVFVLQVLPEALKGTDWKPLADTSIAEIPFDAVIENEKTKQKVRIQVKNQRRSLGQPMQSKGCWVVEVQKTRAGTKNGEDTRPYRFGDFDLLAVCLHPASGRWTDFAFSPVTALKPRKADGALIEIMQLIPKTLPDSGWTANLIEAVNGFVGHKPETLEDLFKGI